MIKWLFIIELSNKAKHCRKFAENIYIKRLGLFCIGKYSPPVMHYNDGRIFRKDDKRLRKKKYK
ncbi:hypothetical protein WH95_05480 [Kiloniella litopenaei]|uniref:Uncharacterized protein n=1 Tax=Kiloniella litopenaei TaxID=1549748 RepID=A0A0M2RCZ2_9PROT|nr:hypothetical protein WH95_05480 [Kiloniella litopenaei]